MRRTMNPQINATVVAICGPSQTLGWWASTCSMMRATVRDMTATGPMETSFDVPNSYRVYVSRTVTGT